MNKLEWKNIRDGLREVAPAPAMPPADEFWERFKDATARTPQQAPTPLPLAMRVGRPLLAAAAVLAVLLAVGSLLWPAEEGGPEPVSVAIVASSVEEIEVYVPYSSVMVMQDADSGTSVVWVTGLEENAGG